MVWDGGDEGTRGRGETGHSIQFPLRVPASPRRRFSPSPRLSYLRTVTLKVPTFPLLSNERSEMVCSPAASWPKSTE